MNLKIPDGSLEPQFFLGPQEAKFEIFERTSGGSFVVSDIFRDSKRLRLWPLKLKQTPGGSVLASGIFKDLRRQSSLLFRKR